MLFPFAGLSLVDWFFFATHYLYRLSVFSFYIQASFATHYLYRLSVSKCCSYLLPKSVIEMLYWVRTNSGSKRIQSIPV